MVTCVPPTVYHTICAPDITYWPYDVMNCSLEVGAWMQTGEEITVNTNRGIVSNSILLEHCVSVAVNERVNTAFLNSVESDWLSLLINIRERVILGLISVKWTGYSWHWFSKSL
jgi:hypothetical protein